MKQSRLYYSIMNSSISTLVFFLKLIMQFVVRTFFIRYLGVTYLGLNGLFTNVLSILSLAELGIGTSIVYSMYKPIAVGDKEEINALMDLYKTAYHFIGVGVAVIGVSIIPLFPYISGDYSISNQFILYYLLYLSNSVLSYFFTYKRSLLIAHQRTYIVNLNDFIFLLLSNVFQIYLLIHYKSFSLYLIVQLVFTLLGNVSISLKVDKDYNELKRYSKKQLSKEKMNSIKRNVIGNMSSKIGGVIVMETDSILISSFVGLSAVGFYSNYTMIVNNVQNLCKQVTNSITASIGNYIVSASTKDALDLFKKHLFVNYSMLYFSTLILASVLNPFIIWWIGDKYVLPSFTVFLIIINLVVQMFRNTSFVFIDSYGLYWIQRWKSIIEATINLTCSLILLIFFNMGINGVLLGTLISSLGYVLWVEVFYIFKYGLKVSMSVYIKLFSKYCFLLGLATLITVYAQSLIAYSGLVSIIYKAIMSIFIGGVLYLVFYSRSSEFKYLLNIAKKVLGRKS